MFLRYLARKHKRVYLLVESEEEGQKMFGHFEEYYRGTQIVGMAKVSAKNRADDMLINAINGEEVDCVLSALSSPLQEELISKNRKVRCKSMAWTWKRWNSSGGERYWWGQNRSVFYETDF